MGPIHVFFKNQKYYSRETTSNLIEGKLQLRQRFLQKTNRKCADNHIPHMTHNQNVHEYFSETDDESPPHKDVKRGMYKAHDIKEIMSQLHRWPALWPAFPAARQRALYECARDRDTCPPASAAGGLRCPPSHIEGLQRGRACKAAFIFKEPSSRKPAAYMTTRRRRPRRGLTASASAPGITCIGADGW